MPGKRFTRITTILAVLALWAIALSLLFGGLGLAAPNAPTVRGVSNFDDITLADDLVVGDDADVGGALTFGANDLYPLGDTTDGQAVYAASSTVTGTLVITGSTHGLSSISSAQCTLNAPGGNSAGDPAVCNPIVSGTVVTVTIYQDDFATEATSGILTSYALIGSP